MSRQILVATLALFVLVNSIVQTVSAADDQPLEPCNGMYKPDKKDFPNLFDSVNGLFYELFSEVTLKGQSQTFYVKESYDITEHNGFLDMKIDEHMSTLFLYLSDTKESFSVENNICETQEICDIPVFEKYFVERWEYCKDDWVIMGPSAMLYHAYMDSLKSDASRVHYCGKYGENVREMNDVEWWAQQLWNGDVVEYYFAGEQWANQDMLKNGSLLPVRVTYRYNATATSKIGVANYEIISLLPIANDWTSGNMIPRGFGCKRSAKVEVEKPPSYKDRNWYMESEVVFTSTERTATKSQVANIKFMFEANSAVFAYETTPWYEFFNGKTGEVRVMDTELIIFDGTAGILYEIDPQTDKCKVSKTVLFDANITLPNGGQLYLISDELFIGDENFQYLGKDRTRNVPTEVFEKSLKKPNSGDTGNKPKPEPYSVYTRYISNEHVSYSSAFNERHVPLAAEVRTYKEVKEGEAQLTEFITLNTFDFTTLIFTKKAEFDMKPCFKKEGQGVWFQMAFPIKIEVLSDLFPIMHSVQEAFLAEITDELKISSMRIGDEIMVDYDDNNLYVTAFMHERPDILLEYFPPKEQTLTDPDFEKSVVTIEECARSCVDEECWGFSYCGATCFTVSKEPEQPKGIVNSNDCQLYRRMYPGMYGFKPMPFVDDLLDDLQFKVLTGKFVLTIPAKRQPDNEPIPITLEAYGRIERLAKGLTTLVHKHEKDVDSWFMRVANRATFSKTLKDQALYGKVSYTECKLACINQVDCESLSYCATSSECYLSTKHGDELVAADKTPNTQCAIFSKMYTDDYREFSGIVLTAKAKEEVRSGSLEDCSKRCSMSKDYECRSFDYCAETEDKNPNCYLHVSEIWDSNGKDVKRRQKIKKCSHYARNYVKNYKPQPQMRIKNIAGYVLAEGLTLEDCARECARSVNCPSFDFCNVRKGEQSTCIFGKKKYEANELEHKDICTHFSPKEIPVQHETKKEEQHSNGLAAGMGILFFIIGSILGAVALFVYGYLKANK